MIHAETPAGECHRQCFVCPVHDRDTVISHQERRRLEHLFHLLQQLLGFCSWQQAQASGSLEHQWGGLPEVKWDVLLGNIQQLLDSLSTLFHVISVSRKTWLQCFEGFVGQGGSFSRQACKLEDVDTGAGAACVKHDPVEDLETTWRCLLGAMGLRASLGAQSHAGDAEEGLGGGGPVPLDIGNVDEQAHTQPQRVYHLGHPQCPMIWYFSHFSGCPAPCCSC